VSGEEIPPQPPDDDTQQDFSEPLDPADAVVGGAEPPEQEEEEEPEPEPKPQRQALPAETPSTSNNALIMQIKILSEYAKDIKRSMNAVAQAAGVHHEYVRRAVSNLVTAVVEPPEELCKYLDLGVVVPIPLVQRVILVALAARIKV
jgi:hypothetical protein